MHETIRQYDALSDEQHQRLFNWGDDIWGAAGVRRTTGLLPETHFVLERYGLAASHVNLRHSSAVVGGQTLRLAGLGGVVTAREAQGQGYASRLIRHVIEFYEREWQVEAGFLFCFERFVPFYSSLGFQQVPFPVVVDQPEGPSTSPSLGMVKARNGVVWPGGKVQLLTFPW